jgi:hypothetical protein
MNRYENLLMGKNEVEYILDNLNENDIMFEWGSGGSTYTFSKLVKKYYSIEHSADWYGTVVNTLKNKNINNVEIHHVDIHDMKYDSYLELHAEQVFKRYPSFKKDNGITYATTRDRDLDWHHFIDYINKIKAFDIKFDKIFIDGRARPMCAFLSLNYIKDDGIVYIHDFGSRDYYKSVIDYYRIEDEISGDWPGSLVALKKI